MGFRDFLSSVAAIFRLAHKSDREEFSLYLKMVALGMVVVGTIGFLIKLIGNIFFGQPGARIRLLAQRKPDCFLGELL